MEEQTTGNSRADRTIMNGRIPRMNHNIVVRDEPGKLNWSCPCQRYAATFFRFTFVSNNYLGSGNDRLTEGRLKTDERKQLPAMAESTLAYAKRTLKDVAGCRRMSPKVAGRPRLYML